jgi:hypothetical protein
MYNETNHRHKKAKRMQLICTEKALHIYTLFFAGQRLDWLDPSKTWLTTSIEALNQ